MSARLPAPLPPNWPFASEADYAHYEEMRRKGYALLKEAHGLWMEALAHQMRAHLSGNGRGSQRAGDVSGGEP